MDMGLQDGQPFPLSKLLFMFMKSLAKPISRRILHRAHTQPFFRDYVCRPPAQLFHFYEAKVKFRVMNLGRVRVTKVPRLSDKDSLELGANLFSEMSIMALAMAVLGNELRKFKAREARLEEQLELERLEMVEEVEQLSNMVVLQESNISGLYELQEHHKNVLRAEQQILQDSVHKGKRTYCEIQ